MSWFSILPPSYTFVEVWVVRIFLLLGTITIGPWLLLLIYDGALYIIRTILYEIPLIGGRASNRARHQARSLSCDLLNEHRNLNRNLQESALTTNIEVNTAKYPCSQIMEGSLREDFSGTKLSTNLLPLD